MLMLFSAGSIIGIAKDIELLIQSRAHGIEQVGRETSVAGQHVGPDRCPSVDESRHIRAG
jgi:hypothetical protein